MLAKVLLIISRQDLPTPGFPAEQFVKYGKIRPVEGRLIQQVPFEVPDLAYPRQEKFVPATQASDLAARLAPREESIRDHDLLQVRRICIVGDTSR